MGIRDRLRARLGRLKGRTDAAPSAPATRPPAPVGPGGRPTAAVRDAAVQPPPVGASSPPAAPPDPPPKPAAPPDLPPKPAAPPDAPPKPAAPPDAPPKPAEPSAPPGGPAASQRPVAPPAAVGLSALLADDHATSDAPVRNAHYAETFETTDAALQVRVHSSAAGIDITFPCEPGETVLDAAERAGHELPFSCRGGGCLVCAGRVDAGAVEMEEQYVLDEEHIRDGFRLLCCTRVTTDAVFESHLEDAVD